MAASHVESNREMIDEICLWICGALAIDTVRKGGIGFSVYSTLSGVLEVEFRRPRDELHVAEGKE